jgi:hypothetical protein
MNSEVETTPIDAQDLADLNAVMRRIIDGTPVDPEITRRIRERAERVTEETHRAHGDVDVNQLLHDSRDDA